MFGDYLLYIALTTRGNRFAQSPKPYEAILHVDYIMYKLGL